MWSSHCEQYFWKSLKKTTIQKTQKKRKEIWSKSTAFFLSEQIQMDSTKGSEIKISSTSIKP